MLPETGGDDDLCLSGAVQIPDELIQLLQENHVFIFFLGAVFHHSQEDDIRLKGTGVGVLFQYFFTMSEIPLPIGHLADTEGGIGIYGSDIFHSQVDVILFFRRGGHAPAAIPADLRPVTVKGDGIAYEHDPLSGACGIEKTDIILILQLILGGHGVLIHLIHKDPSFLRIVTKETDAVNKNAPCHIGRERNAYTAAFLRRSTSLMSP